MTTPGSDYHSGQPPAPRHGRRPLSSRRVLVFAAAALLLGAVAIVIALVLPKAWQTVTGPSRQAGREYAEHWLQSPTAAGPLNAFDIAVRCVYASERAAAQGVDLGDGGHLAPGRIIRTEFREACIDEAEHRVGQH